MIRKCIPDNSQMHFRIGSGCGPSLTGDAQGLQKLVAEYIFYHILCVLMAGWQNGGNHPQHVGSRMRMVCRLDLRRRGEKKLQIRISECR